MVNLLLVDVGSRLDFDGMNLRYLLLEPSIQCLGNKIQDPNRRISLNVLLVATRY